MKNNYIIKKKEEFDQIIQNGEKIKGNIIIIYYHPSLDNKKYFGFAVGKKLGNAVNRNLIKRRLRMLIHNNQNLFSNKYKYIIMIRKECLKETYSSWEEDLKNILGKVK